MTTGEPREFVTPDAMPTKPRMLVREACLCAIYTLSLCRRNDSWRADLHAAGAKTRAGTPVSGSAGLRGATVTRTQPSGKQH